MPPAIRTIGQPTGDPLEDARRLERSTWWALHALLAKQAEVPMSEEWARNLASIAVRDTRQAWAAALRDLDALQFPRRPVAGNLSKGTDHAQ